MEAADRGDTDCPSDEDVREPPLMERTAPLARCALFERRFRRVGSGIGAGGRAPLCPRSRTAAAVDGGIRGATGRNDDTRVAAGRVGARSTSSALFRGEVAAGVLASALPGIRRQLTKSMETHLGDYKT